MMMVVVVPFFMMFNVVDGVAFDVDLLITALAIDLPTSTSENGDHFFPTPVEM